jgi:4-amino-4-deoxy-L-arabinose transferase-like glycosyltransferase
MVSRTSFQLTAILFTGLALRLFILCQDAVPFNADEAIVALMARHTLHGAWPVFFYGQSYMGSMDAALVAAAFALLGQSVLVIRLVQTALFLGIVATTYALGIRLLHDQRAAAVGALLMSVPTVLVSTYTTAALGGYGEVLVLGNLILLSGHAVITDRGNDWRAWLGLGAAGGLGFWTSALTVVYLLPIGLLILVRGLRGRDLPRLYGRGIALATGAFFLFGAPWWWHNLTHDWSALGFLLTGTEASGIGIQRVGATTRLAGLALLGLPALMGMRMPWSFKYMVLPAAGGALLIYVGAVLYGLVRLWHDREPGKEILASVAIAFGATFLGSRFGTDATGRYFLPLAPVLALAVGALVSWLDSTHHWLGLVTLGYLVGFNLLGTGLALTQNPPGLTTQFDPSNRFDNAHDEELINFLKEIGVTRGYSNYFVAFRIAFLSQEEIVLSSQLPYKPDLSYNPADDRYPPYTAEVEKADEVVYVTAIHPMLDNLLADRLTATGTNFAEKKIGPYHVFFDLARKVTPQELGLGHR